MSPEQKTMMIDGEAEQQRYARLTVFFLALSFFFVIGGYTIAKELKNSVFAFMVGKEYIPWARFISMIVLIPMVFGYSKLVDSMRRHYVLCFYSVLYGVLGFVFAFMIGNPLFGLANGETSPYRIFGWLFYFFIEGYSPFLVGVFWAFANSVSTPEQARKSYGLVVAGSKFGGMFTAGAAWLLLTRKAATYAPQLSDVHLYQYLLAGSSVMILLVPVVILFMMRKIPGRYLHGYEAVYQLEKQKKTHKAGIFDGLRMLFLYPYVLGIFGMSFFYDVIEAVLSYLVVGEALNYGKAEALAYLMSISFETHLVGFFIAFFGTTTLFNLLGTRRSLLLIPTASGLILLYMLTSATMATALAVAMVLFRSLNYALSLPLRESLYIPTVKEIKFKSKSWIDAFGTRLAKSSGSSFNLFSAWVGPSGFLAVHSIFFSCAVGLWFVTAVLLGKRFDQVVAKNEVIGADSE